MAGDVGSSDRGVETAILLVGGLVLLLFGAQYLSETGLRLYHEVSPGPAPPTASTFWVDFSVALAVDLLFLLAGVLLLLRVWAVSRKGFPR